MNILSNIKTALRLICLVLLIPLTIVGIYFYWKVGWAIDDGIFYPKLAKIGLFLFPLLAISIIGLWTITRKFRTIITIGAIFSLIGTTFSIAFVFMAEAFPERFNLYKGERFFEPIPLEDLENIYSNREHAIYYIGNDTCPTCSQFYPAFSTLVGKYKLLIQHYDPYSDEEHAPEQVETTLQTYGIQSIPTVLIIKEDINFIFNGDYIVEHVHEYFEENFTIEKSNKQ